MMVIPSVDIKDYRCVKLVQGRPGTGLDVSGDPLSVAKHWESQGAEILHVVDLDGAIHGSTANRSLIQRLVASISIPVQVGGGIRTVEDAISLMSAGAYRVIVGTAALENPGFIDELTKKLGQRVVLVSLDARQGIVLKKGWTSETSMTLAEWARQFEVTGVAGFLFTDVSVEGTLRGPDLRTTRVLVNSTSLPVIYAGGISSLSELVELSSLGVHAAVVGMALYQGSFTLKEAQEACKSAESRG